MRTDKLWEAIGRHRATSTALLTALGEHDPVVVATNPNLPDDVAARVLTAETGPLHAALANGHLTGPQIRGLLDAAPHDVRQWVNLNWERYRDPSGVLGWHAMRGDLRWLAAFDILDHPTGTHPDDLLREALDHALENTNDAADLRRILIAVARHPHLLNDFPLARPNSNSPVPPTLRRVMDLVAQLSKTIPAEQWFYLTAPTKDVLRHLSGARPDEYVQALMLHPDRDEQIARSALDAYPTHPAVLRTLIGQRWSVPIRQEATVRWVQERPMHAAAGDLLIETVQLLDTDALAQLDVGARYIGTIVEEVLGREDITATHLDQLLNMLDRCSDAAAVVRGALGVMAHPRTPVSLRNRAHTMTSRFYDEDDEVVPLDYLGKHLLRLNTEPAAQVGADLPIAAVGYWSALPRPAAGVLLNDYLTEALPAVTTRNQADVLLGIRDGFSGTVRDLFTTTHVLAT